MRKGAESKGMSNSSGWNGGGLYGIIKILANPAWFPQLMELVGWTIPAVHYVHVFFQCPVYFSAAL